MAKFKITPEVKKMLNQLASKLPVIPSGDVQVLRAVKGQWLIDRDIKINDTKPTGRKTYVKETTLKHNINHSRRLRKAYEQNGEDGVKKYLVDFEKTLSV